MARKSTGTPHPDLEIARDRHEGLIAIRERMIANVFEQTSNVGPLMTSTFSLAACEPHLGIDPVASLRLGVEAGLAIFAAAAVPGQDVAITLAGTTLVRQSRLDKSVAHVGRWETTLYAAILLRDAGAIRTLCALPPEQVLASTTTGPRYTTLWFEAMRGAATGAIDEALLVRALEATDPEKVPKDVRDSALYLRVPAIDVLFRIATGGASTVDEALATALDKHRRYWTKGQNARASEGYVSWPLSALAELARGRGHAIRTESPYLVRVP